MAIPQKVLDQAKYDQYVGGKNMPKNPLQAAQEFLRSKFGGTPAKPAVYRTPLEQVKLDQQAAGKAVKAYKASKGAAAAKPGAQGLVQQVVGGLGAYAPVLGIPLGAGLGLYADSKKTGNETPFISGRGADFGSDPHHLASMRTYADGTPVRRQVPKTTRGVVNVAGQSFDMGDPKQKAAYEKFQEQELERQRKRGGGFSDIRGGDGLKPSGGGERFEDPRSSVEDPRSSVTGRDTERTNAKGVVQKGTDMSGANALLQRLGIDTVQYGKFESNHLPGSQDPTEKTSKTDTDAVLVGETPKNYVESGKSPENPDEKPTAETNIVNSGAALGSRERYRSEFLADRPNMRNYDNESLVGLRAAEASKGLLYASGKYWMEDGEGGFTEIDKGTFKDIKRGNTHANEFLQSKIEATKAIDQQPTLVQAQSDAKEYDYGSDAQYGGTDVDKSTPDPADYPEATAVAPSDNGDGGAALRMSMLQEKKAQGEFDKFFKKNQ